MARSTYISENLTQDQISLMLMLDGYEMDIFTLQDLKDLVSDRFDDVNELVENLVHKEILSRIERGKYCRSNFRDENVISNYLVQDGAIAYWSALNLHGLSEQFPNSIFVQTTKVKQQKEVFGVTYKFIKILPGKSTGIMKQGYGNHRYRITDVEKTIVDCFDLPQYSGGYAELIRAVGQASLNGEKMISYCRAIHNIAATKRIGYLVELLKKKGLKSFVKYARNQVNPTYNLFDPKVLEKGSFVSDWRLRMNISQEEILDITSKQY